MVTLVCVFIKTHGISPLQSVHFAAHFTSKIEKKKESFKMLEKSDKTTMVESSRKSLMRP